MSSDLRDFLEIPYDRLEEMNLEAKAERLARVAPAKIRDKRMKYLAENHDNGSLSQIALSTRNLIRSPSLSKIKIFSQERE